MVIMVEGGGQTAIVDNTDCKVGEVKILAKENSQNLHNFLHYHINCDYQLFKELYTEANEHLRIVQDGRWVLNKASDDYIKDHIIPLCESHGLKVSVLRG